MVKRKFVGVTGLGAGRAGRQNFGREEDVLGLQRKLLGDSQREIQIDFVRGVGESGCAVVVNFVRRRGKVSEFRSWERDGAGSRTVGRGVRAEGEIQDGRREARNDWEGKFDATECAR